MVRCTAKKKSCNTSALISRRTPANFVSAPYFGKVNNLPSIVRLSSHKDIRKCKCISSFPYTENEMMHLPCLSLYGCWIELIFHDARTLLFGTAAVIFDHYRSEDRLGLAGFLDDLFYRRLRR